MHISSPESHGCFGSAVEFAPKAVWADLAVRTTSHSTTAAARNALAERSPRDPGPGMRILTGGSSLAKVRCVTGVHMCGRHATRGSTGIVNREVACVD
jgi:hypothetical protein